MKGIGGVVYLNGCSATIRRFWQKGRYADVRWLEEAAHQMIVIWLARVTKFEILATSLAVHVVLLTVKRPACLHKFG